MLKTRLRKLVALALLVMAVAVTAAAVGPAFNKEARPAMTGPTFPLKGSPSTGDLFIKQGDDAGLYRAVTSGGEFGGGKWKRVEFSGDAAAVTSGTLNAARIPTLDAAKIGTGTIPAARLGSGTANSSTYLRGDGTWAAAGASYKVYTALLSQSGTNAPTATVLENTLGFTPAWSRTGAGQYEAAYGGSRGDAKLVVFAQNLDSRSGGDASEAPRVESATDTLYLKTYHEGLPVDFNCNLGVAVEIRLYP